MKSLDPRREVSLTSEAPLYSPINPAPPRSVFGEVQPEAEVPRHALLLNLLLL